MSHVHKFYLVPMKPNDEIMYWTDSFFKRTARAKDGFLIMWGCPPHSFSLKKRAKDGSYSVSTVIGEFICQKNHCLPVDPSVSQTNQTK